MSARAEGKASSNGPRLIVGIGASAGGLEACKRFLAEMPAESGMAFVLVMHLDPAHESHLAEILKTTTVMEVAQASGEQTIEPDHVYVVAPNSSLEIRQGMLNSNKPNDPLGRRKPIDAFFSSLAEDQHEHAVAIVLSGAGKDGSEGIQDIKAAGGLCIAQDPESAQYDSMPRSTIGTGAADHVLSPEQMPKILLAYAEHPHVRGAARVAAQETEQRPEVFDAILDLLSKQHKLDFRDYKKGTLQRRTERRLGLKQLSGWQEYLEYLRKDPKEAAALYDDLLIDVTSFFRDQEVWNHLEREVVPNLLADHSEGTPFRIWVPGCATGEEAYSLAIFLLEQRARTGRAVTPRIYATDVDEDAVALARRGLYSTTIANDVSPERLQRFFRRQGESLQVCQEVRDSVTFAVHNLLTDAPFSKLDIVSCRNLLIYLEQHVQERVLDGFHFALRKGALLILGSSETIGRQTDLFETLSKKHRIYRSRAVTRAVHFHLPQGLIEGPPARELRPLAATPPKGPRVARRVEQLVLSRYTSACVAISRSFEILYFFGPTHDYLVQPTGEARLDLLSWTRPGLFLKLRSALRTAVERNQTTTLTDRIVRDGVTHRVECTIEPMTAIPGVGELFLVAFRDVAQIPTTEAPAVETESEELLVRQLEGDLKDAREELHGTIEQLEGANANYQASHEELLSLNEELQSSNEELVSSKEELQSLNEEMVTINRQLEEKNSELRTTNADLNNLFLSTETPIIFLDRELRVRRFTPAATVVMRLVASDVGRSIEHIKKRFHDERLFGDAAKVLETSDPLTTEVATDDGHWYLRRVVPYRTEDDRVDGVSITFSDVTAQKRAAAEIDEARLFAESIVRTIRTPLVVLDVDLRVVSANERFYESFRVSSAETQNHKLYDLGNRQWDIPGLRELLEKVLPQELEIRDYEVHHPFEHLGLRHMQLNAKLMTRNERPSLILLAIEDITERTNAELLAAQRVDELAKEHHRKDEFLGMLGHELRNPLSAVAHGLALLGEVPNEAPRSQELRVMMTRHTERIATILDQLLDIARVVSGNVPIAKHRIDLADVVRSAVEAVRPFLERRKHELTLSLPPDKSALVMGDSLRLSQVVDNLLTNAIKYTDEGGKIALTLELDQDQARITVRDNGPGMSAELLSHIFEVFTQAPSTLHRSKGGLGLGLPMVERLVAMHDGQVKASSSGLGQGSEFVVTLPRLLERRSKERLDGAPAPTEPGKIRARRILVVDDEEDTARLLTDILDHSGHQTLAVNDGPAALAAGRSFAPEVVLIDLGLPGMDGYEVARSLREEHGDKKILLIAVTGYQRDATRLREAGFDHHLIKPTSMRELSALIAAWGSGESGTPT